MAGHDYPEPPSTPRPSYAFPPALEPTFTHNIDPLLFPNSATDRQHGTYSAAGAGTLRGVENHGSPVPVQANAALAIGLMEEMSAAAMIVPETLAEEEAEEEDVYAAERQAVREVMQEAEQAEGKKVIKKVIEGAIDEDIDEDINEDINDDINDDIEMGFGDHICDSEQCPLR